MAAKAKYEIVLDQGENVGLKCLDCNQARWNQEFEPKDWSTQKDCANCKIIKDTGAVVEENQVYYLREQKKAQARLNAKSEEEREEAKKRVAFIKRKISDAEERFSQEGSNA